MSPREVVAGGTAALPALRPPPRGTQAAAGEFEAAFIAEMLKRSGFDRAIALDSGFGGEAMASFMVDEIASLIAESGGFGIAEVIELRLEKSK